MLGVIGVLVVYVQPIDDGISIVSHVIVGFVLVVGGRKGAMPWTTEWMSLIYRQSGQMRKWNGCLPTVEHSGLQGVPSICGWVVGNLSCIVYILCRSCTWKLYAICYVIYVICLCGENQPTSTRSIRSTTRVNTQMCASNKS